MYDLVVVSAKFAESHVQLYRRRRCYENHINDRHFALLCAALVRVMRPCRFGAGISVCEKLQAPARAMRAVDIAVNFVMHLPGRQRWCVRVC